MGRIWELKPGVQVWAQKSFLCKIFALKSGVADVHFPIRGDIPCPKRVIEHMTQSGYCLEGTAVFQSILRKTIDAE
jgi:hypothetical protein